MKPVALRLLFTLIFSVISTALASVLLYTLPVLYYVGYQTQILPLMIGFVVGTLVFSIIGTVLTYLTGKAVIISLIASIILLTILVVFYKMSGPVDNFDLMVGAMSSQSFTVFFSAMFQSAPRPRTSRFHAALALVVYTLVTVLLFLVTALIYLEYGQAFLPNIVIDLEILAAVVSAIALLVYSAPSQGKRKGGTA